VFIKTDYDATKCDVVYKSAIVDCEQTGIIYVCFEPDYIIESLHLQHRLGGKTTSKLHHNRPRVRVTIGNKLPR